MIDRPGAQTEANDLEPTPPGTRRRARTRDAGGRPVTRRDWLREPKSAVWMALAVIVVIGGGRKLLWSWRARKAVERLSDPSVTPEEIQAVAEYGRAGAWELLRLFSTSDSPQVREAAGRALARLWREDELVGEEEQALVRRGFTVNWSARRRYPRSLTAPIPLLVSYEVPFLTDDPASIRAADLEWSHRIVGARRAALEEYSAWTAGRGEAAFSIIPGDFPDNGPHRLVLQTRVRTAGLPDAWEIELTHVPFQFDFDPILRLDAILTLSDAVRDEALSRAIGLETPPPQPADPPRLLPLGGEWVLRNPPRLTVATPLPADLAHRVSIEFEGHPGRLPAGSLILSGQGLGHQAGTTTSADVRAFPIGPIEPLPDGMIERPGPRRIRVHLAADAQLGWADPDVRSVWPGAAETNWADAEIIRQ